MTGALIVDARAWPSWWSIVISRTAVVVPQQSAFVVERLGTYRGTLDAGFHILLPVHRRHPLPPLAQGDGGRHPRAGLHHARQRAGARRRRALPEGARTPSAPPTASPTTCSPSASSRRPRCAARSARSTSTAPSRSARTSTSQVVNELDKAIGALGHQGAALRDQEHHAARRTCSPRWRSRCAPSARSAPSILTSEGERDAAINNAEGEKQQVIKASEAKRQQQINEAEGGRGAILRRRRRDGRGHPQGRRGDPDAGRLSRRCSCASPSSTSNRFGELAKEGNTHGPAGERRRRRLDDRARDERDAPAAAPGLTQSRSIAPWPSVLRRSIERPLR